MTNLEEFKIKLRQLFLNARVAHIERYALPLLDTMKRYDISTSLRQKHFLAQIGHESGELYYVEEIASGAAYEGRRDLGNTQKGDGRKFKGMGLIQITGRHNVTQYDEYRNMNGALIKTPRLIAQDPFLSADVAGWFWHTRSINVLADRNDIIAITRRINGGTNGLAHRRMLFNRANRIITRPYLPDLPETPKQAHVPTPEPTAPVVKKEMTDKEIQSFLNSYLGIRLVVDGVVGPRTKSAIKEFQSKNGIRSTGNLNAATKNLMLKILSNP